MEQLLELENTTTAITLCTDHYNVVYRSLPEKVNLLAHQKCKTCNREISKKTDYHHCPDPRVIKEYLRSTVGYDVDINRADIICLTCYKVHKTILEQENEQSKDKDLQELMVTLKTADIPSVVDNEVTLAVAETIYKQEAILLPTAYDMLTKLMRDHAVIGDKGISKQHLFSHLKQTLNKHLACCTLQKSAGTLLYRKDVNLLLALTKVLQRERKGKLDGEGEHSSSNNESSNSNQQDEPQTDNSLLAKVCTTMNTKLHHQAKKFMDKGKTDEMDLTSLDMDQLIDSIDPALWSMIINLTKSCREAIRPDKHPLTHSRKLRCFYCLCVVLFITNNQCNKPLHVLLTDVLASHIGAQDKIKILNQLGAVASEDTHARYFQDIVQKKRQEGNTSLLSTLVAISVDNVGFLQSHAAIYSGDQHRSWQGTTVQALVYRDSNATCSSSINAQSTLSNNKNDSPQATPSLSQTSEGVQATPQTSEGVQATHPPSRTSTGVQVTETPSLTPTSSGVRATPPPSQTSTGVQVTHPPSRTSAGVRATPPPSQTSTRVRATPSLTRTSAGVRITPSLTQTSAGVQATPPPSRTSTSIQTTPSLCQTVATVSAMQTSSHSMQATPSLKQLSTSVQASEPNDCAQSFLDQSLEHSGSSHAHEPLRSAQPEPRNATMTHSHSEKPTKSRKRRVNDNSIEGQRKRARTEKENGNATEMYEHQVQLLTPMTPSRPYNTLRTHKITSYHLTEVENKALTNFKHKMFSYTGDRHCAFDLNTTRPD